MSENECALEMGIVSVRKWVCAKIGNFERCMYESKHEIVCVCGLAMIGGFFVGSFSCF